jgi:hypothetical protein
LQKVEEVVGRRLRPYEPPEVVEVQMPAPGSPDDLMLDACVERLSRAGMITPDAGREDNGRPGTA